MSSILNVQIFNEKPKKGEEELDENGEVVGSIRTDSTRTIANTFGADGAV